MLSVMQRIWLWYDYSCLPQRDVRNDRSIASSKVQEHGQYEQLEPVLPTGLVYVGVHQRKDNGNRW